MFRTVVSAVVLRCRVAWQRLLMYLSHARDVGCLWVRGSVRDTVPYATVPSSGLVPDDSHGFLPRAVWTDVSRQPSRRPRARTALMEAHLAVRRKHGVRVVGRCRSASPIRLLHTPCPPHVPNMATTKPTAKDVAL